MQKSIDSLKEEDLTAKTENLSWASGELDLATYFNGPSSNQIVCFQPIFVGLVHHFLNLNKSMIINNQVIVPAQMKST